MRECASQDDKLFGLLPRFPVRQADQSCQKVRVIQDSGCRN